MPKVTPRKSKVETFGVVTTLFVEPWSPEQIASAAARVNRELYMPKVSERQYRANAGRESLEVTMTDGSTWDDAFELLSEHPRTFIDWAKSEFQADSDGETINPSLQTVLKRFQTEGLRRGKYVGYQVNDAPSIDDEDIPEGVTFNDEGLPLDVDGDVIEDMLGITLRTNVTKVPKWARSILERGTIKFGELIPEPEVEVVENAEDVA